MFKEFNKEEHHHVVHYARDEVEEYDDVSVPSILKWIYVILPIWGIIWLYLYWGGSQGYLDRGYWAELQDVANTKNNSTMLMEARSSKNLSGQDNE